ncbi:ragulator complex protein LAMTOR4 [Lingula anatina]|uniref:Late endosomal/lysosomal adaptor and MAPK and MTOR activator 4 n=1 Tax=Lingula anatina TaxID=7574 RepID=A0A1S3JZY1_LINAN|nr:ragulator complex protein LAMTOR4 [Lingula anatina]XP_013415659.1 ragulator complex protein LAMTOR4 [Lingula anatina]|eukprot:XP_013415651.1 ragulator complex protein LAMTOR4 [Lingula anatina]
MQNLERIPDSLGYLVISEDKAVVSSGGELENDEKTAALVYNLVQKAYRIPVMGDKRDGFKKLTINWDSFFYAITVSNNRIYVCKRQYNPQEPMVA